MPADSHIYWVYGLPDLTLYYLSLTKSNAKRVERIQQIYLEDVNCQIIKAHRIRKLRRYTRSTGMNRWDTNPTIYLALRVL